MDNLPGHERREERREGRHERRENIKARLVKFGERFDSDELLRGEVELATVPPNPDQSGADEASEPWAWHGKEMPGPVRERLRGYKEFLENWRREHHDDYDDQPGEGQETEVAE